MDCIAARGHSRSSESHTASIEDTLRATPGVLRASVNVGTEEAEVEYLPAATDLTSVEAAAASAGHEVTDSPPPVSEDWFFHAAAPSSPEGGLSGSNRPSP